MPQKEAVAVADSRGSGGVAVLDRAEWPVRTLPAAHVTAPEVGARWSRLLGAELTVFEFLCCAALAAGVLVAGRRTARAITRIVTLTARSG